MISTLGYMVVKEFSAQAFSVTVGRLADALVQFSKTTDVVILDVHKMLIQVVPTMKLKIIQAMLIDFDELRHQSKTIDTIMDSLNITANEIYVEVGLIEKAQNYYNECWLRSWRPYMLDVKPNIGKIKESVLNLDRDLDLLKALLPSCVAVVVSLPKSTAVVVSSI
jgi:hypothetical protein